MSTKLSRLYNKIVRSEIFLAKSKLKENEIPSSFREARNADNEWLKLVGELIYNVAEKESKKKSGETLYRYLNKILGDIN